MMSIFRVVWYAARATYKRNYESKFGLNVVVRHGFVLCYACRSFAIRTNPSGGGLRFSEHDARPVFQRVTGTLRRHINRKYPTADPKSRLPSRGARRWNASHRAADAASFLVTASNTKSSRASIADPW